MQNDRPQTSIDPNNPHGFYTGMPDAVKAVGSVPLNTLQAIPGAVGAIANPTAAAFRRIGTAIGQNPSGFYGQTPRSAAPQLPLNSPPPNFIQPT